MEISPELIAAEAAFTTAAAHRDALGQATAELHAKATRAAARLPEIDAEIDRLRGAILEDDAVAGVVGAVRLSVKDRAEAERQIASLRAERGELAQAAEGAEAGGRALSERITAAISAVSSAAGAFVKEKRQFDATLAIEFQRDFGRLTLPDLFRKWAAIPHGGITARLDGLSVASFGGEAWDGSTPANSPVLYRGRYLDPDAGWVDWTAAWRGDQALVARRADYIAVSALETRCSAIVARAETQRRNEAETARLAEQRRRTAAYHPASVSRFTAHQPRTPSELEPRMPPPQVIGPYLGEAS